MTESCTPNEPTGIRVQEESAKCPKCHRISHTQAAGKARWYCHHCRMEFEALDDGDVTYGRPEKRLEREEQQKARQRTRHPDTGHTALRGGLGR